MKIFNQEGTKEICNIPFDLQSIQNNDIYSDKIHMLIPIQDKQLLKAICFEESIIIENELGGVQSDNGSLEICLYMDMESENFNVCLAVGIPQHRNTPARAYPIEMTLEEEQQLMWELVCLL